MRNLKKMREDKKLRQRTKYREKRREREILRERDGKEGINDGKSSLRNMILEKVRETLC